MLIIKVMNFFLVPTEFTVLDFRFWIYEEFSLKRDSIPSRPSLEKALKILINNGCTYTLIYREIGF